MNQKKSPKSTIAGIMGLIMTGLSIALMAFKNPIALADPNVIQKLKETYAEEAAG